MMWTLALLFPVSIPVVSQAADLRIMKRDPNGQAGTCTGPLLGSVDDVLKRNGVNTRNATTAQKTSLAKGIQQLERLAGGAFAPAKGAVFNFINKRGGVSNQGEMINMRGGEERTANTAYLMHELGHRVGNSGYYSQYKGAVRSPCIATHYCRKSYSRARYRNEEFAEAFSAFVTHPEILLNGSPSCKAAYDYFAQTVFKNGRQLASCGAATALVAQGRDPLGGRQVAAVSVPTAFAGGEMRAANCPKQASPSPGAGKLVQLTDYLDDENHASEL